MSLWLAAGFLAIVAVLIHYRPTDSDSGPEPIGVEGFTTTAVHPTLMPECVARSTDAQALLARVASFGGDEADELRLLVSKLCCMEADIATPSASAGPRTMKIQFRTSHDMEPPSSIVGRCLRNAVNQRDIDLIIEKFRARGHILVGTLCTDPMAMKEFDGVVARLQLAMTSFCLRESPMMDRPAGPRDVGFWESEENDLPQYNGISAQPR